MSAFKKTKIIATLGPACTSKEVMTELASNGVNVFRINASHTSHATMAEWVKRIRSVSAALKEPIAILVDLQGPRIRTGKLPRGVEVYYKKGDTLEIVAGLAEGSQNVIATSYMHFPQIVNKGTRVLIDNGMMELEVLSVHGKRVKARVLTGGLLGENKGINIPNADIKAPALTEKDKSDLKAALKLNVDFIALSFVRNASDITAVKGRMRGKAIPVIAKIEKPEAVQNIDTILEVADGILVARGDLGIEMPAEKLPTLQKMLIERANRAGVLVITATQMLESMTKAPRPTRAEVSDVANAVMDGADALMLSGETAIGKYPIETVRMMTLIILEAERHFYAQHTFKERVRHSVTPVHAIVHAGRNAAHELGAKSIVTFTISGKTALLLSKLKPTVVIFALTTSKTIYHRLALYRGVRPLVISRSRNTDRMVEQGERALLKPGLIQKGERVVIVSGKQALPGARYMVKIHQMGGGDA